MDLWAELTRKRSGADRYVATGVAFAVVGVGMWLASLVFSDVPELLAVSFVVVGLSTAGIAKVVGARRKDTGTDQ